MAGQKNPPRGGFFFLRLPVEERERFRYQAGARR